MISAVVAGLNFKASAEMLAAAAVSSGACPVEISRALGSMPGAAEPDSIHNTNRSTSVFKIRRLNDICGSAACPLEGLSFTVLH